MAATHPTTTEITYDLKKIWQCSDQDVLHLLQRCFEFMGYSYKPKDQVVLDVIGFTKKYYAHRRTADILEAFHFAATGEAEGVPEKVTFSERYIGNVMRAWKNKHEPQKAKVTTTHYKEVERTPKEWHDRLLAFVEKEGKIPPYDWDSVHTYLRESNLIEPAEVLNEQRRLVKLYLNIKFPKAIDMFPDTNKPKKKWYER